MEKSYDTFRYNYNLGYRVLHVKGTHTADSVLPYLHHCHNYMLTYVREGKATIKVEGRKYNLSSGDIIILNPSELFQTTTDNAIYHERISLSVSEAMFATFPDTCNTLFAPFYNRKKGVGNFIPAEKAQSCGIKSCLDEILLQLQSDTSATPLLAFCKIVELLNILNRECKTDIENDNPAVSLNPLISEVLKYLNLHYQEDLNIASVAEVFHINKYHLSHLFKEHMGMSLWSYVTFRRIQLFNELIRHNDSVENTCYLVGFKNYSNFFRLYKKYMKTTPTQYKKQVQSGDKIIVTDSALF